MIKRLFTLAALAGVVFSGIYLLVTVYDDLQPHGRMWETPAVRPLEAPDFTMASGTVPFSGGEALFRGLSDRYLQPQYPVPTPKIVNAGKTAYGYYCIQCHGENYDGMGTVGQSFSPLPTDLRSAVVQSTPPAKLFRTISYGVPGGRQPALHGTIAPEERWQIIAFILSLRNHGAP